MMSQFSEGFGRARQAFLGSAAALILAIGCPLSGRSRQAAPPAVSSQGLEASANALADIQEGIRKGTLFYATAPLSERTLRQMDGTPAEYSFTVPLTVDRTQNRLFVQALINGRNVRLILDTAGGPDVALDEATARDIKLIGKVSVQVGGSQGTEAVTLSLAHSLTLGRLTLGGVATTVSRTAPFYSSTLGMEIFKHYRVTLDFAAKTMTLARGGVVTPPSGSAALLMPFDDHGGYIFVPVRVLDQAGWAVLDSGSDATCVSFKAAKAAATQLPLPDVKTVVITQKIGMGETDKKVTALVLKVPVPISMNTGIENPEFNTTSRVGTSDIDDVLGPGLDAPVNMNAQLGLPFLLQFQRVIIDYPNHSLILQYPAHDIPIKEASSLARHDRAWPGYKWRQVGYAWIEVPDGKSVSAPPAPPASPQITVTQTTSTTTTKNGTTTTVTTKDGTTTATNTQGLNVVVTPPDNGSIAVFVNGTKSVYPFPPGSTVKVTNDGVVLILPPGSTVKGRGDGSVTITPGIPAK